MPGGYEPSFRRLLPDRSPQAAHLAVGAARAGAALLFLGLLTGWAGFRWRWGVLLAACRRDGVDSARPAPPAGCAAADLAAGASGRRCVRLDSR
jgi:hypothetical protein